MKALKLPTLLGTETHKGLIHRSGMKLFLSTLILKAAGAWQEGENLVQIFRADALVLAGMLVVALGLAASPSKKG